MADWEQMAREVLVAGRPDKVQSAALGWKELLKNIGQVQESLQQNVKDLGVVWKGPAYEAFKSHVEALAKQAGGLVDAAEKPGRDRVSIVTNLETAARQLQAAQDSMPIPSACVGDVLAARNGEVVIGAGLFETRVKADLMGSWPMEKIGELGDWVSGWFSDQEEDARKVYNGVNGDYQDRVLESPSGGPSGSVTSPRPDIPNLGTGPGTGGGGGVPGIGGTPSAGGLGGPSASAGKMPDLGSGGPSVGSSAHPDLTSGGGYTPSTGTGYTPSTGYPSTGTGGDYGTGLAGAGTATAPGLGSGFGSGGGLPGSTGLGGSAGGLGGGGLGGGGIGRAVSPGLPPMMGGGGMAGAGGRGAGGRAGAGKLGAGGKLGPGGMAPGMGGGMAGGGGRGAARGGAAGAAGGARGAGARGGTAGMGHGGGAGYGEEDNSRNTWLEEDEDIWGADSGGTPGILR